MLSLNDGMVSETINLGAKYRTPLEKFDYKGQEIKADFANYKDELANTVKYNLKLIDELPPLRILTKSQIKEHMAKRLKSNLEKDALFEKSVSIKKYVNDIVKYLTNYFREVFDQNEMITKNLHSELYELWRMYYNSDLPLKYILIIERAILLHSTHIAIYDKVLRKERVSLLINRNNRKKFEHLCKIHNNWIGQFADVDKIDDLRIKFFWYIDFCNCHNVEEILKVKKIKTSRLSLQEMDTLTESIDKLANKITPLVEKYADFEGIPTYKDDGIRVLSKIVDALSITEG